MAEVDWIRITEVVSNLLNNAAKYSAPGSSIKASLTSDEENVMISVKDDGLGIEAEALPHIFDAFHANHEVDKPKPE
jgi:signal transduction histidine kinase